MSTASRPAQDDVWFPVSALSRWWYSWRSRRHQVEELNELPSTELHEIAHDANVATDDLISLAGKWPDSANLLVQRAAMLQVDLAKIPQPVLNDMTKLCSLCAHRGQCRDDLTARSESSAWSDYCPNSEVLASEAGSRPGQART